MIETIAARHSPQDVALTRALTKGHAIKAESAEARTFYRVAARRWMPQSGLARFRLEPVSA